MEQYFSLLSTCPLFADIDPQALPELLRCLQARAAAYRENQPIMLEGDPVRHVGIVLSGAVQVVRDDFYGNRSILTTLTPTQLFAEVFACAGVSVLPVSVIAACDSQVLLLDCRRVSATCPNSCTHHQQLVKNLLHILAAKNLMLNQKLEVTAHRTTREKLMAYLLQEAKRAGSNTFTIPYDRQGLADYLGVDRSAMSTELGKLKKEGLLDCHRSSFVLPAETAPN